MLINAWQLTPIPSRQVRDSMVVPADNSQPLLQMVKWWRDLGTGEIGHKHTGAQTCQQAEALWLGCRMTLEQAAGAGPGPDLSLSPGSLSPSWRLRNVPWVLFPEGTRPFDDSLFLGPPVPRPEVWWHSGVCSPAHHLISHRIPGTLPAGSECSTWAGR